MIFYAKYFRKDVIKVQVVGYIYIHKLLHGKMKIKKMIIFGEFPLCKFNVVRIFRLFMEM